MGANIICMPFRIFLLVVLTIKLTLLYIYVYIRSAAQGFFIII